ncbi:MAG: hypothetical protein ABH864_04545 [archaeon]
MAGGRGNSLFGRLEDHLRVAWFMAIFPAIAIADSCLAVSAGGKFKYEIRGWYDVATKAPIQKVYKMFLEGDAGPVRPYVRTYT